MKHLLFFEDGVVGAGDITQVMWGTQHGWEVGPSATTWPKRTGRSLVLDLLRKMFFLPSEAAEMTI